MKVYKFISLRAIDGKLMEMFHEMKATSAQEHFSEKELEVWHNQVMEMVQPRHLITVYDAGIGRIDGGEYLDSAILKCLFKATSGEQNVDEGLSELKLALAWDRIDLVKEAIFSDEPGKGKQAGLSSAQFAYLMPYTLEHDRIEFVREYLAHGLEIGKYLTIKNLMLLYNNHVFVRRLHAQFIILQ